MEGVECLIPVRFGLLFLRLLVASASPMASAELLMPSASELESLQLLVFIFSFFSRHDLEIQERKILQNLIFTEEKLLLQLRTIAGVERHVSKQHFSVY